MELVRKCQRKAKQWLLFVGDCHELGEALAKKPNHPSWLALRFLDAMLRGYGQIIFANNPITGLLFISGITVANPFVSLCGLITGVIGLLAALATQQPKKEICAGYPLYCPILIGLVTSALLPPVYGLELNYRFWVYMIIGAIFSMYLTSALASLFGSIGRYPLPCFAVPFCIIQVMVFICVIHSPYYPPTAAPVQNLTVERIRRDINATNFNPAVAEVVPNLSSLNVPNAAKLLESLNHTDVEVLSDTTSPYASRTADASSKSEDVEILPKMSSSAATSLTADAVMDKQERLQHQEAAINKPQPVFESFSAHDSRNETHPSTEPAFYNTTQDDVEYFHDPNHVDWGQVFTGVLLSISQVFGVNSAPAAALMYLGVLIFSPTLGLMCVIGATISTLTGLVFSAPPYDYVYQGVWGFNGLLSAAALGGFCFVLTPQSAALGVMCALFTTCLQHVLDFSFSGVPMPVLSIPFNVSAILFLGVTTEDETTGLVRPDKITFPERHRHDWKAKRKAAKEENQQEEKRSVSGSCQEKEEEAEQQRIAHEEV